MRRRGVLILLLFFAGVWFTYRTVSAGNTMQSSFDTIIVLGSPTELDGSASVDERAKVGEAVREVYRGRAAHVIMTGGAAHNRFVEAQVEAQLAYAAGIPASQVLLEGRSMNTVENLAFSWQIMQAHGWHSAEVISVRPHLPRAALMLEYYEPVGLRWRVHPAPFPAEYSSLKKAALYVREVCKTVLVRWFHVKRHP